VRATFPGLAYQFGTFLASWITVMQSRLTEQHYAGNYAPALAWTVVIVATLVAVVTASGREAKGADMSRSS
jgi:SHS family lactate transporter-like MFS transporter